MIASRNKNQFQSSLDLLRDLLKALMFFSNLNGFNSSPSLPIQGFTQRKGSSKMWKKKGSKWFFTFFSLFLFSFLHYLCVLLLFWVSPVLCFALLNMFLSIYFQFCLFFFHKKNKKNWKIRKIQNNVCVVYIGTCVPWMAIETNFPKFCISCNLDKHLYAQLSKWALWFLFVMSKIKLSLILNTHITLFDGND